MANRVLDSWALMAFFEDESAAEAVEELLDQASRGKHKLFLTSINWAEVYYSTMRETSQDVAEQHAQIIASLPIEIVGIGDDLKLARQAAIYKATYRLSLADAFAAALAKEKKAELVTGDQEFKALDKEIKMLWLTH
ncbi:type II toxin-antitoxin system VapC family toxin [Opitutus sp. GAS368]|uniref:type II toxin-antitoxin system VapC family toxin n=1 Tax=Opitutus sp. GAS368 TaxID=1882749 RepID=UPI00087CDF2B|nr:type II toxin-antitoxin system VapC family toxin [Opitutus sp. GAS368]SDR74688.1 ribonuclease VapC [Opitutus sp. GAS368]